MKALSKKSDPIPVGKQPPVQNKQSSAVRSWPAVQPFQLMQPVQEDMPLKTEAVAGKLPQNIPFAPIQNKDNNTRERVTKAFRPGVSVIQRMMDGDDDPGEDKKETKKGNTGNAKQENTQKSGKSKKKGSTANNRKKQTGTGSSGQKIPQNKEELRAAVRSSPGIRFGFDQALDIFLRTFKGSSEQLVACRIWAKQLLEEEGSGKKKEESEEGKRARVFKEFNEKFSIDSNDIKEELQVGEPMSNGGEMPAFEGDTAFVANLITTPTDLQKIVDSYAKLYNPSIGFAMVIGVNLYRSCDGSYLDKLRAIQMPKAKFPLTILVFSWDLPWTQPYEVVCNAYSKYKEHPGFSDDIKAYERSFLRGKKNSVPYGKLRSQVLAHAATANYVQLLSRNFQNVYIFNTDADAPSFLTQEQKEGSKKRNLLDGYAREIKKSKTLPKLMVGGYRFDEIDKGGDLDKNVPSHRLTLFANQLDSAFRSLLSFINSELIYPTEPNMIFLAATYKDVSPLENLKNIPANQYHSKDNKVAPPWGSGPREGIRLRENIRTSSKSNVEITNYLPHLATPTDSTRFRVPSYKHPEQLPTRDKFFDERIKAMFSEEQTYITKIAVILSGSGLDADGFHAVEPAWVNKFIFNILSNAIKEPGSIGETKKFPQKQHTKKGIADLFETQDLTLYFINQNISLIKHIHGELVQQYAALSQKYNLQDLAALPGLLQDEDEEEIIPEMEDMEMQKALVKSVTDQPGFATQIAPKYNFIPISGEGWLCFVRCCARQLGKDETYVQSINKLYKAQFKSDLSGHGIVSESDEMKFILEKIKDLSGVSLSPVFVILRDSNVFDEAFVAPSTYKGDQEIYILHAGAHYSLLTKK